MPDIKGFLFDELEAVITTSAIDEAKFLPLDDLHRIITADAIAKSLPVRTGGLARLLSYLPSATPFWSDSTLLSQRIEHELKKVFTILVLIGHVPTIEDLLNDGLTDQDLPLARKGKSKLLFSLSTHKEFTSFKEWDSAKVFLFLEKQSIVQSPVFEEVGQNLKFQDKFPLPFTEEGDKIDGGGGVFVHRAGIHPAHCSEAFRRAAGNLVAIKEIHDKQTFIRERDNLDSIKKSPHKHLVQSLATIEMGSLFYVVFPWAHGGDVGQFWRDHKNNLQDPKLIKWSLEQMLGLADGIMALHRDNFRHGDIKPQNVLHFKPAADSVDSSVLGTLVIADVGVSRRHTQATHLRKSATTTNEVTISYEAPEAECDQENGKPRSRKYDQWSLGCMYLEFIVWLLYGFDAVEFFRRQRTESQEDFTTAPGNFFTQRSWGVHSIHSRVTIAIEELRKDPRCGEHTALGDLLTLVEQRLLQIDPEKRAEAEELSRALKNIFRKAENDANYLCKPVTPILTVPEFFSKRRRRRSSASSQSSGQKLSRASRRSSSSDTRGSKASISTAFSGRSSISSVAVPEEEALEKESG